MHKILFWLFFTKIKMATCLPETNKSGFKNGKRIFETHKIGTLNPLINECSGINKIANKNTFYTHNDGGGKAELYEIDEMGAIKNTLNIPNAQNIDWEDITKDDYGNIYIGDFGNNINSRTNLTIYKYNPLQPEKTEKISFTFSDQKAFPPQKQDMNFDCEAFFWANDSLYLFSKNRGGKQVKLYTLPSLAGNYSAQLKETIFLKTNITGADISPNKDQFAILSYGKVFIFGVINNEINFKNPLYCIKAALKQAEAITYITSNELLITNEQKEIFKLKLIGH
jgi:hypothetical protein